MRGPRLTASLLTISLVAISACATPVPGDFCDVVPGELTFESDTAAQVVQTDRATAEQISAQNAYGRENCLW